tara:strand:- start:844 stop:1287 length:444 start_codon:yes stop_codon:yes gene_type:complete
MPPFLTGKLVKIIVIFLITLVVYLAINALIKYKNESVARYIDQGRTEAWEQCGIEKLEAVTALQAKNVEWQRAEKLRYNQSILDAQKRADISASNSGRLLERLNEAENAAKTSDCRNLGGEYFKLRLKHKCRINAVFHSAGMPEDGC